MNAALPLRSPYEWVYRIRGLLMVPPVVFISCVFIWETEHDALIWSAGLGIFLAGMAGRIWAQMHIHYRLRIHKTLTVTGPYAYVRNPIYIANTLILLGLTVLSELLWFIPIMLIWCMVVYNFTIRREESHLLGKYGAPYAAYLGAVSRWLPRRPANHTTRPSVLPWFASSVAAELHCVLWLLPLIAKEYFSN